MNEQLQEKLLQFIDMTLNGVDAAAGFMSEQLPDYITQLILWYGVKSGLYCLAGLLLIWSIYKVNKMQYNYFKGKSLSEHPEITFNLVQSLWIFPIFSLLNIEWLQIIIAPKVWLVEYASNLAN